MKFCHKNILAYFLSLLIFSSTTSFATGIHICKSFIYDIGLFTPAEKCPMHHVSDQATSYQQKLPYIAQGSCCVDETLFVSGSDKVLDQKSCFDKLELVQVTLQLYFNFLLQETFFYDQFFINPSASPPKLISDKQAFLQVYII